MMQPPLLFLTVTLCLLACDKVASKCTYVDQDDDVGGVTYPFPLSPYPKKPTPPFRAGYTILSNTTSMSGNIRCPGKDDDKVINRAIASGHKLITFSDGTFECNNQIVLRSGVTLQGQGRFKTILKLSKDAPKWKQAGFLRGVEIKNIRIQWLTIDGNRRQQSTSESRNYGKYGFYCQVCTNMVIENIRVRGWYAYGLDPHGEGGSSKASKQLLVRNCDLEDNGTDGIAVDKTNDAVVMDCVVKNNERHGIQVPTGSKNVLLFRNTVTNNGRTTFFKKNGCGIAINNQKNAGRYWGTSDITIRQNTVSGSLRNAVCVNRSDKVRIISNALSVTPGNDCAKYSNANYGQISGNTCNSKFTISGKYKRNTFVINQQNVVFK